MDTLGKEKADTIREFCSAIADEREHKVQSEKYKQERDREFDKATNPEEPLKDRAVAMKNAFASAAKSISEDVKISKISGKRNNAKDKLKELDVPATPESKEKAPHVRRTEEQKPRPNDRNGLFDIPISGAAKDWASVEN